MSAFATGAFTYGGLSRWQLWFDNPNKAAVLFACLALVAFAWGFRCFEKFRVDDRLDHARISLLGWFAVLSAFFSTFICMLLYTFSRGGMIAFGIGSLVVAGRRMQRYALLLSLLACFASLPIGRSAMGRLADSSPGRDASVGNRLVIWRAVPRMMADAPGGWGLGNAGNVFMGWYQPVERRETYRTLVSSHLTWLVEFGRMGRLAYVMGWLFVLGACGVFLKGTNRSAASLPLALWLCLGTAGVFSSVLEAWELWVLPAAAFVPVVLSVRTRRQRVVGCWILGTAVVLGGIAVTTVELIGHRQSTASELCVTRDAAAGQTVFSAGRGDAWSYPWIVYDEATMGGDSFGRVLRAQVKSLDGRVWGVADTLDAVPEWVRQLTLCGKTTSISPSVLARFPELKTVRVLSPEKPLDWLAVKIGGQTPRVFCGEFSGACPTEDLPGLTVVSGARDYLPEWPMYAFGPFNAESEKQTDLELRQP